MILPNKIHDYIKQQENSYETEEIQVGENWYWNMRKHIQLIFHLKNGVFFTGTNDWLRAFKNIMRPMLRLSYWTEDLEVKDVTFFIESEIGRIKSFILRKYHDEVYTVEHDLDTLFDDITESDIDYGGALVQKGVRRPEILFLNSIAFCDQTDILGTPIGFKYYFSPEKLRSMSEFGWGDEKNGANISLEELCLLATTEKTPVGVQNNKLNNVPSKTIEVYVIRGNLPENYLKDNNNMEDFYNQVQVVAIYTDKENIKGNAILYRKKEDEGNIKFHASEKIFGRALGYSDGEALLHPQVWTNFLTIHKNSLLESAAKIPLWTDDPTYTQKNRIQDMENLEITTLKDGKRIGQVPTAAPVNIQLYEKSINEWYEHGQNAGAAYDSLLGKEESAGMTFRGQERLVAQGRGWHDRRRGQRAKFIEQIYQDWIIPDMINEITEGNKFLASLSIDEITWLSEQLSEGMVNKRIKELILQGRVITEEEKKTLKQFYKDGILKKGNRQLFEILKGEFKDEEVKVRVNVAGKQKNLVNLSDKLLSVFQAIFSNPQGFQQAMQIPAMAKAFEDILEFSGLSMADFHTLLKEPVVSPIQPQRQETSVEPINLELNT